MSSEMFRQKAGIEVTLVPFPGAAPAVTALLGQQVDYMIDNLPSSMPHIRSGKFRALAITSATRSAQLPEVPTMTEAGVPMQVTAWFRSEEHTSELQSQSNLVCRLLLEKKNKISRN